MKKKCFEIIREMSPHNIYSNLFSQLFLHPDFDHLYRHPERSTMEFLSVPTLREAAAGIEAANVEGTAPIAQQTTTNEPSPIARPLRDCAFYLEALDVDCSVLSVDGKKKSPQQRMQLTMELCGEKKTCVIPPTTNNNGSSSEFHFALHDYYAPTKVFFRIETVSFFAQRHTIAEHVYTLKELLSLPTINFPNYTNGTGNSCVPWGECVRLSLPLTATALASVEKDRCKHEKHLLQENRQQKLHDTNNSFMTKSLPPAIINTPTSHMGNWLAKGDYVHFCSTFSTFSSYSH